MPKIFLIKDRLQQQQLRLQEAQHLIQAKNSDQLNIEINNERYTKDRDVNTPLSLVAKKRNTDGILESTNQIKSGESKKCCLHKNN